MMTSPSPSLRDTIKNKPMRSSHLIAILYAIASSSSLAQPLTPLKEIKQMTNSLEGKEAYLDKVDDLDDMQKYVTLHDGTEPPFQNKYWDHHEDGIYVDVISGKALFSSTDKFDSGTGWPSFTQPIDAHEVTQKPDNKLGLFRTEVRSSQSDAHLGHVFTDGPQDKGGKRFCINSAALDFVPKAQMQQRGYGQYLFLFEPESEKNK